MSQLKCEVIKDHETKEEVTRLRKHKQSARMKSPDTTHIPGPELASGYQVPVF